MFVTAVIREPLTLRGILAGRLKAERLNRFTGLKGLRYLLDANFTGFNEGQFNGG